MYISLEWLKDFVEIPKSLSPEDLGKKLTLHTVEIDDVISESDKFRNVVVGEIQEVRPHANADRLQVAMVDVGENENLKIVCGAPNIKVGQKVPVALIGAVLPGDIEIKAVSVRGEDSEGMLCAEDELGLSDNHEVILTLDKKAKIGQKFGEYLKLQDVVYEVDNKSITNRPDLWCHMGMARDIAVFLKTKFKAYAPKIDLKKEADDCENVLSVKVEDFVRCPRYMAIQVDNLQVDRSPEWMQKRLSAVGVRPINNIVDITNYVMMELGQPLHAFDSSFVVGKKIIVRTAEGGEKITTLDGVERTMENGDLLISDTEKAIAIAGVMGGENSEIKDDTKSIIIESANFDFISVRKTSARLGLRTDASKRYEKALDPNLCELAISRVVELIKELMPEAVIASKLVDENKAVLNMGPIDLSLTWLEKIIGIKLDGEKVVSILEKLGFQVNVIDDRLEVIVPSWRATKDVLIKEDLAEEVARIVGYDNIEPVMPKVSMKAPKENIERKFERKIKNILSGRGSLVEVYNYSFVGEEQLQKLGIDFSSHLRLIKPIAKQHTLCRQSLVPNLINNIRINQARNSEIGIFEIGTIYSSLEGGLGVDDKSDRKLPYQEKQLGIMLAGDNEKELYADLKGIVEALFESLHLNIIYDTSETNRNWANQDYACALIVEKKNVGSINVLNQEVARKAGLKKSVVTAEISLPKLIELMEKSLNVKVEGYEKFPPLTRDLAFVVNKKVSYNNIKDEIIGFNDLIKTVELFDVFEGEKIGNDNKSMAFHVVYQAKKTLRAEEVDEVQDKLLKHLEERFGAKIRDF